MRHPSIDPTHPHNQTTPQASNIFAGEPLLSLRPPISLRSRSTPVAVMHTIGHAQGGAAAAAAAVRLWLGAPARRSCQ